MLLATGVHKSYDTAERSVSVLRDLELQLAHGEFAALMGSSGAGKSTLLNILGCLDTPSSGSYRLDGVAVESMDDDSLTEVRLNKIGFVFQTGFFIEYLDLIDNVALPGFYRNMNKAEAQRRAGELLQRVGLSKRVHHLPSELSGGERQRAAIARALFNNPTILLADEPTGNLDKENTSNVINLLSELNSEGLTIFMVTHDPEVAACASRIYKLNDGALASGAD